MPTERCWNCNQIKRGVELCPSDDRLCPDCYESSEQQLKEQRALVVIANDKTAATVPADDLLNLVDEAAHKTIGVASGDSRKLRPKQAKSKKVKQDEQLMPRPPGDVGVNEDNGDPSRQNAVTAAASAPAATEDISALRQLVNSQQCVINKLLSRMNFVLSFLGISEADVDAEMNNDGSRPLADADVPSMPSGDSNGQDTANKVNADCELWSAVVSKRQRHHGVHTLQQSVVAAVYVDQSIKKRREASLIVSGLAPKETMPDMELFANLCTTELQVQPDIISAKRLGHLQAGKIQPILVHLKQADQAKKLISKAKLLRRSSNSVVREQVFINPNLTKAEAAAAYQIREQRRLAQQQRRQQRTTSGQPVEERSQPNDSPTAQCGGLTTKDNSDYPNLAPPYDTDAVGATDQPDNP
jgi:hypothetical protein